MRAKENRRHGPAVWRSAALRDFSLGLSDLGWIPVVSYGHQFTPPATRRQAISAKWTDSLESRSNSALSTAASPRFSSGVNNRSALAHPKSSWADRFSRPASGVSTAVVSRGAITKRRMGTRQRTQTPRSRLRSPLRHPAPLVGQTAIRTACQAATQRLALATCCQLTGSSGYPTNQPIPSATSTAPIKTSTATISRRPNRSATDFTRRKIRSLRAGSSKRTTNRADSGSKKTTL